ncbi:hypothetical protein [Microbacterium sp. LWH11-1.2]|uniref:hypothetical protein n=1 Tax=Microbacterium sp. LWH11-1.2 TaxID=3135258 RepID=UPI0031399DCA
MSVNEKMVKEAAKAILDNFHAPDDRHPSWWINPDEMARAALAVFEKAHGELCTRSLRRYRRIGDVYAGDIERDNSDREEG